MKFKSMKNLFFFFFCIFLTSNVVFSQQTDDYDWANVPIGGGGYITGMKIHPLDSNLKYYRTDVGGAYRWDAAQNKLVQLIYSAEGKHYSVAGIALDPTDTNIVYLAVGQNCNASQTAIYKSNDKGETFTVVTGLPFYFAANGGRQCDTSTDNNAPNTGDKDREGNPIEINPLNTNELYIGTRERGLYILNIQTDTWKHIPSTQIPHNKEVYSIRTIKFHPTNPELVFLAYMGYGIYRGNTITQTYERLDAIGNTTLDAALNNAMHLSFSKDADYMLVACKRDGILKAKNLTATRVSWSSTPITNNIGRGYLTVECSPHDNNTAITVAAAWNQLSKIEVTTDGGNSWKTTTNKMDMSQHIFPWRNNAFGNNVAQFAFDPTDANKLHFTDWFSTFSSDNWTATNGGSWHTQNAYGHEEIVPTDLMAFPSNQRNNFLMTGSADHSGILFDDLTEFNYATETTTDNFINPATIGKLKKSSSMDFCYTNPDHLVVCLTEEWDNSNGGIAKSIDGGQSWELLKGYNGADEKSIVAISSQNPDDMIFLGENGLKYTANNGVTIQSASGVSAMPKNCFSSTITCLGATNINSNSINNSVFGAFRNLTADKTLGCVFYFYDWNGDFSISTDGGASWCIVNKKDLPASNDSWQKARLTSIPNQPGHLWFNINKRLFRTTDGGMNWTELTNVNQVYALGSGVGAQAGDYDALYIFGSISGFAGNFMYRSTDEGLNWVRINDPNDKEAWGDIKIVTGDRMNFGRIYATSSGQGVLYGQTTTLNDNENSKVTAKLLLEGFYDSANDHMHTILNDKNLIPLSQPYNTSPWNYMGNESVLAIPKGVVDWILINTRDAAGNTLNQAAGFVTQSGDLMSTDGTLGIPITDAIGKSFSIHHRSHLAVLSASPYNGGVYDFTTSTSQAMGNNQLKLVQGKYMLYGGDYDALGIINNLDYNNWRIQGAFLDQYLSVDGDGNGIINNVDYNLWIKNKSKMGELSIQY